MKNFNKVLSFILAFFISLTLLYPVSSVTNVAALGTSPSGICMSFYSDVYSRGFAWQTDQTVGESKLLLIEDNGGTINWDNAQVINGKIDGEDYKDFQGYRYHKAHVENLTPGAKYYYKVGGNGVYSEVGTFTVEGETVEKATFVYVTDSQEESAEGFGQWRKTLEAATETVDADFIAFTGDLVNNSHADWGNDFTKIRMEEWTYAFDVPKNILRNVPFMGVAGNHESAGYTFVDHVNIDYAGKASTGGYYSFDYGPVHVIGIDGNMAHNQSAFEVQLEWLKTDLAATDKEWKVVMIHEGVYSTGDHSNDSDCLYLRSVLPQVMADYEVDLVLQGHDHVYTRTMPYYYGAGENGRIPNRTALVEEDGMMWNIEPDGTFYVTINYAGTKNYPPVEYDTSRIFPAISPINGKDMSQHIKNRMFATVEIEGDEMYFKSYISYEDGTEELYDYFLVRKNTYADAGALVDALPESVTPRDSLALKQAKDSVDALNERALLRLGQDRINKLNGLLSTFDLQSGLNAYEVITAIDLVDVNNMGANFWSNYATAKNMFYSLSEEEKELVVNKDALLSLEETISQRFLVEKVQELIDNLKNSKNFNQDKAVAIQAYNLLSEEAKAQIVGAEILNEENAQQGGCNGSFTTIGLYVAIAFVVLAGAGVGVYFIIKKRSVKKDEN